MSSPEQDPGPPPDGVLESCLYAEDLAAAERFFTTVLGLTLHSKEPGRHVFFRCAGQMVLVFRPAATEQPPAEGRLPVPTHGARGPGHLCFSVEPGGLPAWRKRLEAAGVAIEAEFAWPHGPRSLYFRDPAGNSLELAERTLWFPEG